jgi:mitochondrial fission process protein 1
MLCHLFCIRWVLESDPRADIAYHTAKKHDEDKSQTLRALCERSVFQGLASLFLPMITIHTAVDLAGKALNQAKAPRFAMRWGPSMAGMMLLPVLPVAFDVPVEIAVEKVFEAVWPVTHGHAKKHE